MTVVAGGSKANLITGYTTGEDNQISFGKAKWLAQTFTLDELYVVWRCRFKSWTTQGGNFYEFALRATTGAGAPTGADLATTTLSPSGESFYSPGKWKRFDFGTFPNLPAGVYALIARVPTAQNDTRYKLRCDATTATYVPGKAWESNDNGNTWVEITGTDFIFEIWGWQPPPTAEPAPVISNWAPLDVEFRWRPDGFDIQVTTDIPCHLYMRWTTTKPLTHPSTEYRRGILIQTGTRYCFVGWEENEQIEAGDTYIHTFVKYNWAICTTRYFYFIGTKQAEEQPSASPIFHLHRTAKIQKPYEFPELGMWAGHLQQRLYLYLSAWGAADARFNRIGPLVSVNVGQSKTDANFRIHRGIIPFDCTTLPANEKISAARLRFWNTIRLVDEPFWLAIVGDGYSLPALDSDYGLIRLQTIDHGEIHSDDLIEHAYNYIELNVNGLKLISRTDITKLSLRTSHDVFRLRPQEGHDNRVVMSRTTNPVLLVDTIPA